MELLLSGWKKKKMAVKKNTGKKNTGMKLRNRNKKKQKTTYKLVN